MEHTSDDAELLAALRARDEAAFARVVDEWSGSMLRVARSFVSTTASAEEVVQDTWLAVLRGVDRFEGRSTLRTWVFRILVNSAKKRAGVERRTVPLASLALTAEDGSPTVDPARFRGPEDGFPGHWTEAPAQWPSTETTVLHKEMRTVIDEAIGTLPPRQRIVITLRDVSGHDSAEICDLLDITPANQRVLLHRARAVVRGRLEEYLAAVGR